LISQWGIDPVPDEPPPDGKAKRAERAFSLRNHNMNTWGDIFNARQKLSLITFMKKIMNAFTIMLEEGVDRNYVACALIGLLLTHQPQPPKTLRFIPVSWGLYPLTGSGGKSTHPIRRYTGKHFTQKTGLRFSISGVVAMIHFEIMRRPNG
jgi:hypothetical protein